MQKRLKSSAKVEIKEFNIKRFEEENPFYISTKSNNPLSTGKYEDEEQPR
jgi:hypothetical protein